MNDAGLLIDAEYFAKYAPDFTTPLDLESDWAQAILFAHERSVPTVLGVTFAELVGALTIQS